MTTLTERDEFLDLVLADEDFVRAEFEAITDGLRDVPGPPARPVRPAPPSGWRRRRPTRTRGPVTHRPLLPERARQRSPPVSDETEGDETEGGQPKPDARRLHQRIRPTSRMPIGAY
jgi:hypothetical protein